MVAWCVCFVSLSGRMLTVALRYLRYGDPWGCISPHLSLLHDDFTMCSAPVFTQVQTLFLCAPSVPLSINRSLMISPARYPAPWNMIFIRAILCTVPSELRTRPARQFFILLWSGSTYLRPSTACFSVNSAPHTRCLMHSLSVFHSRS